MRGMRSVRWYRTYSDMWLEQGARMYTKSGTATFTKPFTTVNYTITTADGFSGAGDYSVTQSIDRNTLTTTSFKFWAHWTSGVSADFWYVVQGM